MPITRREEQIAARITEGKRYREIAEDLEIGYQTVLSHARSLRRKLKVRSRTDIAVWFSKRRK